MKLFERLTVKAKGNRQRIVLPEGTEPRTLTAADRIIADGIAEITLIGDPADIKRLAEEMKLEHIKDAKIVNPADETVIDKYAPLFFELRKKKGISMEEARLTTANPLYLGCLMVKAGDADGQVAGAMNTTGNVLRAAFQVIKTQPGIDVVSGAFLMLLPDDKPYGTDGILVFADCAVVPDPNAAELAQIAVSAGQTARDLAGIEPRVAILSFSTKGSAKHERVDKVIVPPSRPTPLSGRSTASIMNRPRLSTARQSRLLSTLSPQVIRSHGAISPRRCPTTITLLSTVLLPSIVTP